jgi:hypothetical protein
VAAPVMCTTAGQTSFFLLIFDLILQSSQENSHQIREIELNTVAVRFHMNFQGIFFFLLSTALNHI